MPMRAGDALIGDARLLHAAHANESDTRRSLVTLWYQPWYDQLAAAVQATLRDKIQPVPAPWPEELRERVTALHPRGDASVAPLPRVVAGPRLAT